MDQRMRELRREGAPVLPAGWFYEVKKLSNIDKGNYAFTRCEYEVKVRIVRQAWYGGRAVSSWKDCQANAESIAWAARLLYKDLDVREKSKSDILYWTGIIK